MAFGAGHNFYPESTSTVLEGLRAKRRTSTAQGSALDISRLEGNLEVIASVTAVSGTNPTLDITIEERVDADDTWAAIPDAAYFNPATDVAGVSAKFTQVTTTDSYQIRGLKRQYLKAQIRVVGTIGGTSTPTFDFGVIVRGEDRYTDR